MQWRFIHIPKTAGTAIRHAYGSGPCKPTGPYIMDKPIVGFPDHPHLPAACFPDAERLWTVIRNPFDRAVSICAHLFRFTKQPLMPDEFQYWVYHGFPLRPEEGVQDGLSGVLPGYTITDSQTHWLYGQDTKLMVRSTSAREKLGRHLVCLPYERLESCLEQFLPELGIKYKPLEIHNPGGNRKKDYEFYYDGKENGCFDKVREKYETDVALWQSLWTY